MKKKTLAIGTMILAGCLVLSMSGMALAAGITESRAEEIALEKAGLKASEADFIKLEKDYDDGRYVYEGEIFAGRTEYEFEICAETGRVLDFEIDR